MRLTQKNQVPALASAILCLLLGGLLYIFSRSSSILLNHALHSLGLSVQDSLRYNLSHWLPGWVKYSLSDGLWMMALVMIILVIWHFKINRQSMIWLAAAFCLGFGFEFLQAIHWIAGSFDPVDILLQWIGFILPFFLFPIKRSYEKSTKTTAVDNRAGWLPGDCLGHGRT